jgi:hypothetical protein
VHIPPAAASAPLASGYFPDLPPSAYHLLERNIVMARKARTARVARSAAPRRARTTRTPRPSRQSATAVKIARPKNAVSRSTTSGTTTTTRSRRGRVANGLKGVTRTHTKGPAGSATTRKATTKTKSGLTRTAKVRKTTTGTGANRVARTTRTITRVKNGRKVTRTVTRTNRGGKVTVKRSKPVVSGNGPKTTRPKARATGGMAKGTKAGGHKIIAVTKPRNPKVKHLPGTAPRASRQRSSATPTTTTPKIRKGRGRVKLK